MAIESRHDKVLRNATRWKSRDRIRMDTIGEVLEGYFKRSLKTAKRSLPIVEAWQRVIPEQLHESCRIRSCKSGVLCVKVFEAAQRFEMEMLKEELIESVNAQLSNRKTHLRDIKFL